MSSLKSLAFILLVNIIPEGDILFQTCDSSFKTGWKIIVQKLLMNGYIHV